MRNNISIKNRKRKKKKNSVKRKEQKFTELVIFSNNCWSANKKIESLKAELKRSMATIFTLQETHFSHKEKVQIENMQIYESIRKKDMALCFAFMCLTNQF